MSAFRLYLRDGTTRDFPPESSVTLWYSPDERWGHIEVRDATGRIVGVDRTDRPTWHLNLANYHAWFQQHLTREICPMPHPTQTDFASQLYERVHALHYDPTPDLGAVRSLEVELYTLTNPVEDLIVGFERTISWRPPMFASHRAPRYLREPTAAQDLVSGVSLTGIYRGTKHTTVKAAMSRMFEAVERGEHSRISLEHVLARCLVLEMLSRLRNPPAEPCPTLAETTDAG